MKTPLSVFAFGLLLLSCLGCGGGAKQEDQPLTGSDPELNGTWLCTHIEEGGVAKSAAGVNKVKMTYQFANGTLNIDSAKGEKLTHTYAVDLTTNPKRISFVIDGVKSKDIYMINGKELKICMSIDGSKYPTEFVSVRGSTDLFVFTRK
jgi:uncharacterized protein (TIGR03067 family)